MKADRTRLVPRVLRARDFRLYTDWGRRLVDLWQAGGAAVLGHTPRGVLKALKNTAARGLFTPFPHHSEGRFIKALGTLFPHKAFRVYAGDADILRAASDAGVFPDSVVAAADPALGERGRLRLWRPFLEDPEAAEPETEPEALLVPVLPWVLAPKVLVIPPSLDAAFPPSPLLPPVILAAATRSVFVLRAERTERLAAPRTVRAGSLWRRRGIYLSPETPFTEDAYTTVFLRFLDAGFLLPPVPTLPLILPGILSPGESAKLNTLLSLRPQPPAV
jgi:hypothetical protein